MVRPTSYSIYFSLNASLLQLNLVDPWQYLEGPYEVGSVRPSLLTSVWVFSWKWVICFSELWHGARNCYEVLHGSPIFLKNIFCPKNLGNGPTKWFLNLKKNLAIKFHWICSIMIFFVICCVHAQILYLGKILFLRYRPKCSQPIRLQDF